MSTSVTRHSLLAPTPAPEYRPCAGRCAARASVFSGVSGVGKSSIINCLAADAALPTGDVDARGEGRHVTTRTETVSLDAETLVMDTPGLRKLAVWNILPEDLAQLFPEVRALFGSAAFATVPTATSRSAPCALRKRMGPCLHAATGATCCSTANSPSRTSRPGNRHDAK